MNALPEVDPLIESLAERLAAALARRQVQQPSLVGILTGGLWLAERLAPRFGQDPQSVGAIDIGFHRDDFADRGLPRQLQPTRLTGRVDGRSVVLVDDVLHSGRTVRAAINALFEYGRPREILLAVLVSRGGRQLPIQADAVGAELDIPPDQRIKLTGPQPLELVIQDASHG